MKFVGVREAQARLSGLVAQSQKERIVLTRHGRPIAILTGVAGTDLEEYLLANDPEFAKLIARRRGSTATLVGHESLVAETKQRARPARARRAKSKKSR